MTFARKSDVVFVPVRVNQVIEELASMLSAAFPKNIEIELTLSDEIPEIVADPTQLHQALLNLCVNARDAMTSAGQLTIATERLESEAMKGMFPSAESSAYVVIRVKDTGTGMEESVRKRIFEPFFTTKEPGKGTGLGLAVVYGVVRSHNGFVTVDSTLGEGTTFNLFLPTGADRTRRPEESGEAEEPISGGTETILLVEDEKMLGDLVESLLTANGYTVLVARTGREAIEIFRHQHEEISLVVSDLGLPGMLGNEAYIRMKEIDPLVRTIFATGYLDATQKDDLLQMGAIAIIQKPFIPNQLLKAVRAALEATH
jgi:CheY-like chemotaxis protein